MLNWFERFVLPVRVEYREEVGLWGGYFVFPIGAEEDWVRFSGCLERYSW